MSWFLLTFFAIYGSAHAYALLKARWALSLGTKATAALALPLALLTAGPVLVYWIARLGTEGAARAAAWIAYPWMGLLFLFTCANLSIDAVNLGARTARRLAGSDPAPLLPYGRGVFLGAVALVLLAGAWSVMEARSLGVERVRIVTKKLPPSVERVRVAQISDIHFGLIVRHRVARRIAEVLRRENPDLIVSTGDLVDAQINHLEGLAEILAQLSPPRGKYAVTGNHEFYAGLGQALDFTRRAGFTVLRGEAAPAGPGILVAGVDDPAGGYFSPDAKDAEERILPEAGGAGPFTILLKHRPRLSPAADGRFDLQLSGHTHNGQVFPFRHVVRLAYPLVHGLARTAGGSRVYTSPGTATWGPPMRFLSPPAVTVIDLVRAGPDSG